ncbi:MAG: S8 family serine peptidase, partial [Candidatus Helarchaeota archaeon]
MKINRIIFGIIFFIIIINISISASLSYDNFVHDQTILSLSSSSSVSQSSFSLDDQWNLGLVGARKAHSAGFDGTNASNPNDPVVVAVLDSGVDNNHTELQSSFVNSTDFTGEGTQDDTAHGTHVSGIIASNVRGVAPAAKIYSFKVIGSGGSGLVSWLINALNDLSKNHPPIKGGTDGVDIVTMSLGVLPSE